MFKMLKIRFSPLTQKRLKRFRSLKRAYWSFIILTTAVFLSFGAELIANDKPLVVMHDRGTAFPVLFFYPESEFVSNGRKTEPDYKNLLTRSDFDGSMIWTPISYGPLEIDEDVRNLRDEVDIIVTRVAQSYGFIRIMPDLTLSGVQGKAAEVIGDGPSTIKGMNAAEIFPDVAGEISRLVNQRLKSGTKIEQGTIETVSSEGKNVRLKFSSYGGEQNRKRGVKVNVFPNDKNLFATGKATISRDLEILRIDDTFRSLIGIDQSEIPEQNLGAHMRASRLKNSLALVNAINDKFHGTGDQAHLETSIYKSITLPNKNEKGHQLSFKVYKEVLKFPFRPNRFHLFGLDETGRDVLVRCLYAFRIAMIFSLLMVVFTMVLGFIVGSIQGYFGGFIDITWQRLIEIWSAIPFLYVIILMGDAFGRGFFVLLVCYGIFSWIGISYYVRAEFLRLRKFYFVEAAKALGVPWYRIILRHILPNSLTPIITFFPFSLMGAISILSALDYLGYGLPPPTPSWGELLGQAQAHRGSWWLILYPGLALFFTMLLTVFIGEGMRDAFDPKKFGKME